MPSSAYLDALNALCRPVRAAAYPRSLAALRALLAALGEPHARFPAVVVAGSVGKGTTSRRIACLLQRAGLRVGLYTSPHLHSFRERFAINGALISHDELAAGAQVVVPAAQHIVPDNFSTFELATALAWWWFARAAVDVAVLEVGLGGRYDAVNVAANALAVFTLIEDEHRALLGGSLATVAWHKAGVIRRGGAALTVPQPEVVLDVLRHEAAFQQARLRVVDADELAREACRALAASGLVAADDWADRAGCDGLPGRMERAQLAGRAILIDGGHTTGAARFLRQHIDASASGRTRLVVGMLDDKRAGEFLAVFDAPPFHIVLTRAPGHRALSPEQLRQQFRPHRATVEVVADLHVALDTALAAPEGLVVVTGSLRMAAAAREAFGLLTADELAEAHATRAIFEGENYLARLRETC